MEIIKKYFQLNSMQEEKFSAMKDIYTKYNEGVNLISRNDIENIYERHILHSLSIAKFIQFKSETTVADIGTGGGFPGIPLAVFFSDINFICIDSMYKKTNIVKLIAEELKLENVQVLRARNEDVELEVDFVVSRAVAPLISLHNWCGKMISKTNTNNIRNGMISMKGGDLTKEISELKLFNKNIGIEEKNIADYFDEEFFLTKKIVYHHW